MQTLKIITHIAISLLIITVIAIIPIVSHINIFASGEDSDAVSQASLVVPDQPSGNYVVLFNTSLHNETIDDWKAFFNDEEFAVIFEDISCIVSNVDVNGQQLAQRYQIQLPENQMTVRMEDGTMLASKAEAGYIDVAIFSKEMADNIKLNLDNLSSDIMLINISG